MEFALDWLSKHETIIPAMQPSNKQDVPYQWTGKVIELLELALSIHESKRINNGELSQKAVVNWVFGLFGLKPGNFSSTYGVMRTRADSRTIFLDKLTQLLEDKMDRDDAKELV